MIPSESHGELSGLLADRSLPELRRLADQFTREADYPRALEVLNEVERRLPDHPAVLLDLVRFRHRAGDVPGVSDGVSRLWQVLDGQAADLDLLGEELQEMGSHDLAMATFRMLRKSTVPQVRAVGLSREAALLLRLGDRQPAELAADEAFRLCPGIPETRSARALLWEESEPEKALGLLESLAVPANGVPAPFTVSCGHRLGGVYDRLGRVDEAMQALAHAKSIEETRSPGIRELRQQRRAWMDWHLQLADFDQAQARAWQEESAPTAAHAFLLGHPRSGTTLLEQMLDANPAIRSIEETDHFANIVAKGLIRMHGCQAGSVPFPDFVRTLDTEAVAGLRDSYLDALVRDAGPGREAGLWIDKNPGLTPVVPLIARLLPRSKLIVALRDPRDVCLSAYFQSTRRNAWSVNWLTLQETVEQYVFAMGIWLDVRDRLAQPWIEVRYEDFIHQPLAEGRRITDFLGVDWHPAQADPSLHARSRFVKSPTHADVVRPIHGRAIGRWQRYRKHFAPHEVALAPFLKAFGYDS